jgi:hypothetical protein
MVGSLRAIETFQKIIIHNLYLKLVAKYEIETWTQVKRYRDDYAMKFNFLRLRKKDIGTYTQQFG